MPRSVSTRLLDGAPAVRRMILWALVAGIPVAFLRMADDPFNVPKLVLLTIGVACVLALRVVEILHGRSARGLGALMVPALILAVPLLLSWSLSPYRGWAILGQQARFQGLIPYVLVILLGILVADAFRERSDELAMAFLWAGAIVGGYAIIQTIGADPFDWSLFGSPTEAISMTGNPNFTGGFLGIVLPIGLGVVLTDRGRRRVAIRLLGLTVVGLVVARSQGGWAAGVAGSAIVGGYLFRDRFRWAQSAGWAMAAIVAIGTVGVVFLAMVRPDSRLTTSASLVRARWSEAAFGMGSAHPLAGRGPNSFAIEGVRHRPLEDAIAFELDFTDDPHSVPMAMFANLGLPGLVGFLGVFAWALRAFVRNDQVSLLQVAFMGAVVAYLVQSLVSVDELILRVGLWAALAGSLAVPYVEEKTRVPTPKSRSRGRSQPTRENRGPLHVVGLGVIAVVSLGCIAWAASILVADVYVRDGTTRFAMGDADGGRARYESALSLRDSADYRGRLAFALKSLAIDEGGNVDQELLIAADESFSFTDEIPYVFSIVGHARLLEDAARATDTFDTAAVDVYRRAMQLDPRNPVIRIELAHVLLRGDDPDLALDVLIDLKDVIGRQVPEYWGALALSAARAGEVELARTSAEIAMALAPEQPDATTALEILDRPRS